MRASWLASTLSLFATFAALGVARAEEAAPGRYAVIRGGAARIASAEEVGDLLVVGANVELAGVVRGHVYAVDAELVVRSTAVVLRSITMQGGRLAVEDGAVLPDVIALGGTRVEQGGRLILDGVGSAAGTTRAPLGRGGRTIEISTFAASSTTAIALTKSVLPFDRFAPSPARTMAELAAWDPGIGLAKVKDERDPKVVSIANLAKLTLESSRVSGAFQRGYRSDEGAALFTGLKLADEAAARALWSELERAVPPSKVALSVKTGLGDGAHWYFKRKGRHDLLWQRGPWVFALETKLAADRATTAQERQFSERVLTGLRTALEAIEASGRRTTTGAKRTVEGAKR